MISNKLNVVSVIILILGIILGIASLWIFGYKYGMYSTYTDVTWASFGIGVGIAFSSFVTFLLIRGFAIIVEKHEDPKPPKIPRSE